MKKPKVSVVIASYNTARFIGRAIESVIATEYPNLDLIIVDDGSTDESLNVISSYTSRTKWIRLLEHPNRNNKGIAETRNLGIDQALGEYITFLDADDTYRKNRFEIAIPMMESNQAINTVCEPYALVRETVNLLSNDFLNENESQFLVSSIFENQSDSLKMIEEILKGGALPQTNAITVRRNALHKAGMFPTNLKYCLERPLWLKLFCLGGFVSAGTEANSRYHLHDKSTCATNQSTAAFRWEDTMSYINVYSWLKKNNLDPQFQDILKHKIINKYFHYTTYARGVKHKMNNILFPPMQMVVSNPELLFLPKFWKSSFNMLLGKYNPDHVSL
ncbi:MULTISPECIES: glycosyltransferase family 2 protein [unclassified Synechocystis]|uniref:glycosyltransferase family 2 protein n=1 Tax=unclassified Synechocystis TaxID=2640012 RepID=UPI000429B15F|nr:MULTISPECIES: glycosyltransferase family 2 protein [unclassified Synechocystis]AIE74674.1 Beta-1,3-glucosyltransferase [Synechocystis sp. PCC 6714]MCT0253971.1 glycosyltransferase [Synechocystis sp. CS-94]